MAFNVQEITEKDLYSIFSNFCHFSGDLKVPVLKYEHFLHNLRFVRSENELLDVVKSSILELTRSDSSADGKLEDYFAHYESEKRVAARSMAADENRLAEFDIASYGDFKKAINALGVGFHEVETTRLFCALRASKQVHPEAILKAVVESKDDTPRSGVDSGGNVVRALLDLFKALPGQVSSTSQQHSSTSRSSRRRGDKKGVPVAPPFRGLRGAEQLMQKFKEVLSLIKRVLPLPQPTNISHGWYIAGQLLNRMAKSRICRPALSRRYQVLCSWPSSRTSRRLPYLYRNPSTSSILFSTSLVESFDDCSCF